MSALAGCSPAEGGGAAGDPSARRDAPLWKIKHLMVGRSVREARETVAASDGIVSRRKPNSGPVLFSTHPTLLVERMPPSRPRAANPDPNPNTAP
jgi:hypothetical protein